MASFVKALSIFCIVSTTCLFGISCLLPQWVEYPFNPIYNPGSASFPSVFYDLNKFGNNSAFYKMWYQANNSVQFAFSDDGIDWTNQPITGIPLGAARPMVIYDANQFGGSGYKYKMWFWDTMADLTTISAIKLTMSIDGINWIAPISINQNPGFPLVDGVTPGYFFQLYGPGYVMYNPETIPTLTEPTTFPYVMFYNVLGQSLAPGSNIEQIALAYSMDGILWTRYGIQPVLIPSSNVADWDGFYIYQPSVAKIDGIFHLFYSGANGLPLGVTGNATAHGIGHACSLDGILWIKDVRNPLLYINNGISWRNNQTFTPFVLFSPFCQCVSNPTNVAKMWFTGGDVFDVTAIGYATMSCPLFVPEPPLSFRGAFKKNKFLDVTEYILEASWQSSPTTSVTAYRIYSGSSLVQEISSSSPLVFSSCFSSRKKIVNNYSITAVNCINMESIPVPLVIIDE